MSDFEPKIVAFLCNWCSYAGADIAGVSRIQYPPNIRIIRVPCSGRIDPLFIFKALYNGADAVLVSGCHPGDCHYICGNLIARRKFSLLKNFLQDIGIERERIHFTWVSASEGGKFAQIVQKITDELKILGPGQKMQRSSNMNYSPQRTQRGAEGKAKNDYKETRKAGITEK